MARTTTTARRRNGEGSVSRFHEASKGCPAVDEDGNRPEHTCRALYRARLNVNTSDGGRKRVTLYGKNEGEVLDKLRKLVAAEDRGHVVSGSMPTGEWLEAWLAEVKPSLSVNSATSYECRIRLNLKPALGGIRLDKLAPKDVAALHARMRAEGAAPGTVKLAHSVLRRALRIAMREGLVARNVATEDYVEPPSGKSTRRVALTVEKAWRVLDVAGDDPRAAVALFTALRQAEALSLRWMDLYLDGTEEVPFAHLVVRRSRVKVVGGGYAYTTVKTEAGQDRVVPLVAYVADLLRAKLTEARKGGPVHEEGLVFTNAEGAEVSRTADRDGWVRLLKLAGVGHAALHTGRNTTSQLLENAGVPDRVVAAILGHASVSMTHHYQDGNAAAIGAALTSFEGYVAEVGAKRVGA